MRNKESNHEDDSLKDLKLMLIGFNQKLDEYQASEAKKKLTEIFKNKVVELGIPQKFTEGLIVENEDQMKILIEKVKTDYEAKRFQDDE